MCTFSPRTVRHAPAITVPRTEYSVTLHCPIYKRATTPFAHLHLVFLLCQG